MTTFLKIPVRRVFRWGKAYYYRLDATRYKHMLAVSLRTGVVERFDGDERVKLCSAAVVILE